MSQVKVGKYKMVNGLDAYVHRMDIGHNSNALGGAFRGEGGHLFTGTWGPDGKASALAIAYSAHHMTDLDLSSWESFE